LGWRRGCACVCEGVGKQLGKCTCCSLCLSEGGGCLEHGCGMQAVQWSRRLVGR
jgi:hypothetical protein